MQSCNHPNIARCIDYFWDNDQDIKVFTIVMDYFQNGDVRKFIGCLEKYNKLDVKIIKKWMLQLLYAI